MIRCWWRSLGFYWQVYFFMALAFGCIIAFVEGVIEPLLLAPLVEWLNVGDVFAEIVIWIVSVLFPSLFLGYLLANMVMRRLSAAVATARKLSQGDLGARLRVDNGNKDVFNQLACVFNEMAESLELLVLHEKRLLADISHELRSPLTRMGIATALLPMQRDSDDFDATIRLVDNEIEQMDKLVGLLLEQGQERLNNKNTYSRVDLSELLKDSVEGFGLAAAHGGKCLVTDVDPDIAVWGYDMRVRIIADNILSNALFYAPKNSKIEVSGKRTEEWALIIIRDHGPGVPDKHIQDIFKAFFRVDQSRARASGGAGLGLALAKDAAVAMGGDIEARNANPGLEVVVTLPLYRQEGNDDAEHAP